MNWTQIPQVALLNLTKEQQDTFEKYYQLLLEWNAKFNLTAITEREEVYIKHFADSLLGWQVFRGSVCDVGAGAGFPSLPLAIAGVAHDYVLLDSVGKKVNFLEEAAFRLGLDNVKAYHLRAEEAGRGDFREEFDTVTARAVAPTNTLLEYLAPLARVGGRVVLYKTDAKMEIATAQPILHKLGLKVESEEEYDLDGFRRAIVVFAKVKSTPKAYPRMGNKPRTQPLG